MARQQFFASHVCHVFVCLIGTQGSLGVALFFLPGHKESAVLSGVDDAAMLERRHLCCAGDWWTVQIK